MQLVWSASAPNHVAPVVIHTNRHDPVPLELLEYEARVTLEAEEPGPPAPRPGADPGVPLWVEAATLTDMSSVEEPEVNLTDGSSNARERGVDTRVPARGGDGLDCRLCGLEGALGSDVICLVRR